MRKYFRQAFGLATSSTAKDTYILFIGNVIAAFLGFVSTLFIARALSVADFGIYSAITNLVVIISSLTDLGISSGLISFASKAFADGDTNKAYEYSKAAFIIKIVATLPLIILVFIFAGYISPHWLATADKTASYWVAVISLLAIAWGFLPYILQSKKLFLKSVLIDVSLSLPKAIIPYLLFVAGLLTVNSSLAAFAVSAALAGAVAFAFVGFIFLRGRPAKHIYVDLFKFSSWIGVNRIISSVSGRLDVQMLAAIVGATAAGLYSIPAKLSSFIIILASSFSAVLAPRFASFGDKKSERIYLLKTSLALIPIVAGIVFVIIFAKPFIVILFGQKYLPSVAVFQALAGAMIPFIVAVPAVAAIIYSMKKTIYIGLFSFYQIAAIFLINLVLIPRYGPFAPTIAFAFVHLTLMIYTWTVVIKHYWSEK